MALKRSILIGGVATTLGMASIAGVSALHSGEDARSAVSEAIAQHFELDQTEVESVLEGIHAELKVEHQAERESQRTVQLDEAVTSGVITQEQRERLDAFFDQQQSAREALRDIEDETERQAAKAELKAAFEAFQEDNSDIPFDKLGKEHKANAGHQRPGLRRGF